MMNERQRSAIKRVYNTLVEVKDQLTDEEMIQKVRLAERDCVMALSTVIDKEGAQ